MQSLVWVSEEKGGDLFALGTSFERRRSVAVHRRCHLRLLQGILLQRFLRHFLLKIFIAVISLGFRREGGDLFAVGTSFERRRSAAVHRRCHLRLLQGIPVWILLS